MKKNFLFLVAISGAIALRGTSSLATPIIDEPGLSLGARLPTEAMCGGKQAISIHISNAFNEPVEINSLTSSRRRVTENENTLNGQSKQISEELSATDIPSLSDQKLTHDFVINTTYNIPGEDGVYSEVFTLKWRRIGGESWHFTDAFVKLEVTDGCAKVISDLDYEGMTNKYSLIPFVRDGKELLELAVEGGGTFDGNEEPLPAVADIEAIDMTETAVIVDGNPYQFQDISYDAFADELSDEFAKEEATLETDSVLEDLKYCVRVRYHQDAYQVPTASENLVGMRWWRPQTRISSTSFPLMNFLGLKVELWDRDETGSDDYITSAVLNYTANGQYFCIQFDWDQSAQGETYPDPYIKTYYQVRQPGLCLLGACKWGNLCNDSCSTCNDRPVMSWRDEYYPDLGQSETVSYESLYFTPDSTPSASEVAATASSQAIQMAYMQKFFQIWNGYDMSDSINVHWSNQGILSSSNGTCINLSRYYEYGDDDIFWHRRWDGPVHECGHSYKKQVWGDSNGNIDCGDGDHYGYCSYSYECAMNEGWAEFVAMRSWYPDDIDESEPIFYTTTANYEVEPGGRVLWHSPFSSTYCGDDACTPAKSGSTAWHDCYARNEIMGMRAFWDMMDSNPDDLDLASDSVSWQSLVDIWSLYPSGNANHCQYEIDSNMIDYWYNSSGVSSDAYNDIYAAMQNNSMTYQDPN